MRIANAVKAELERGATDLVLAVDEPIQVLMTPNPALQTAYLELRGRFTDHPGEVVFVEIEIDPARIGYVLEGALARWLDGEDEPVAMQRLGGHRCHSEDSARVQGEAMARRGVDHLKEYVSSAEA